MESREDEDEKSTAVTRSRLTTLLQATLPMDQVVYAFGYGSGVFSQRMDNDDIIEQQQQETKVVDMIVVVKDDLAFHRANFALNPSHYWVPPLVSDVAAWCTWWQRHHPQAWLGRNPGLYFLLTEKLKYGVVQVDDLQEDLQHWKYLYMAGRMQKPVLTLIDDDDTKLTANNAMTIHNLQQTINLPAALASALLLLSKDKHCANQPQQALSTEVYQQIAALSYLGDFRVSYGAEDPQKVTRLVEGPGQLERFVALYADATSVLQEKGILSCSNETSTKLDSSQWTWDASPSAQEFLRQQLPLDVSPNLRAQLAGIVAPSARYQSFKGIVTAGPQKAWKYAARKLAKGLLRR